MKLYLAVAVLMLVFAAFTEAQDTETIDEQLSSFGTKVSELTQDLAEKTKNAFQDMHNSEFATNTRNWFQEQFAKVKSSFDGLSRK
ncbi:apolipoprotein C-I [Lampris incognitus]|uniref:apolipoprotein C-I n=1 Tax=Lampris incognitus TaxID=2546036 RepID=UPI0024B5556B|nr:apolipoprotein C-I [Lampris incognitus]